MPVFYKNAENGKGIPEEHDVRPEGYADAANGWVDPNYVAPKPIEAMKNVAPEPKIKKNVLNKKSKK